MSEIKKVIVCEFNTFHDECLFSFCKLFTQEGYQVTLVANERIKARLEQSLSTVTHQRVYFPFSTRLQGLATLWSFYRYVIQSGINLLFINTAQGNMVWKLFMFPFPKRIKIAGTLHNIQKLKTSFGQRFITRRLSGYVLLNDLLLPHYQKLTTHSVEVIYPVFYPSYHLTRIQKPQEEVWITIPGAVSFGRRDYAALIPKPGDSYAPYVRFIILGNIHRADGEEIKRQINDADLLSHFILFDSYVNDELFYSFVEQSDYILPLIHPSKSRYAKYLTEKISGTYNLAIAKRKPMLLPIEMQCNSDFADTAFFYDEMDFVNQINQLKPHPSTDHLFLENKWTLSYQGQKMKQLLYNLSL